MAADREPLPVPVGLPVGGIPVVTPASGPLPVLVVSATVAATGTAATGATDLGVSDLRVSVSVDGVAERAGAAAPPAPLSAATPDAVLSTSLIGCNRRKRGWPPPGISAEREG